MKKKSFGLVMGATLVALLTGYQTGCSSDSTPPAGEPDATVADAKPRIDRAEPDTLTCLQPPVTLTYRAPLTSAGLCSSGQITDFLNCFGNGDETKCDAFLKDTKNDTCKNTCLLTPQKATNYGALISIFLNYVGYYDMNGVSKGCVTAQWSQFSCETTSCESCESEEDNDACVQRIYEEGGQCRDVALAAVTACRADEAKLTELDADLKSVAGVQKILTAFCGGAADAGPDAADASDASNVDAADSSDAADANIADADDSG